MKLLTFAAGMVAQALFHNLASGQMLAALVHAMVFAFILFAATRKETKS